MAQVPDPMKAAPRDGTRILIRTVTYGFSRETHRQEPTGDKWVEAWFTTRSYGVKGWEEWCGDPQTRTTGRITPLDWAPRPEDKS
jgi:hypothetical protein